MKLSFKNYYCSVSIDYLSSTIRITMNPSEGEVKLTYSEPASENQRRVEHIHNFILNLEMNDREVESLSNDNNDLLKKIRSDAHELVNREIRSNLELQNLEEIDLNQITLFKLDGTPFKF